MKKPLVGIVMGSNSDWGIMQQAAVQLRDFNIPYETHVISAHRTPDNAHEYVKTAIDRCLRCIIASAGRAAHIAGVLAANTTLPILGAPTPSKHLKGMGSLPSTVQMPKSIPVATFAIGESGAANAGLFAVSLLALSDPEMAAKLDYLRKTQADKINAMTLPEPE